MWYENGAFMATMTMPALHCIEKRNLTVLVMHINSWSELSILDRLMLSGKTISILPAPPYALCLGIALEQPKCKT